MSSRTRVTGMYSGIDTESLISQLVEARKTKVTTATKNQMTIEYKQDAWKDLNKKLKSLQTKFDKIKYQSSYSKKTTSVSDSSVASVVTSDGAMTSTQTLKVKSLAKAGYATGNEVKTESGDKATSGTLLTDLGIAAGSKVSISVGGKLTDITIDEKTTLGSFTSKLAESGVNANFDSSTQRIFIGAKDTGADNEFLITASNRDGLNALSKLGIMDDFTKEDSAIYQEYKRIRYIPKDGTEFNSIVDENTQKKVDSLFSEYQSLESKNASAEKAKTAIADKYADDETSRAMLDVAYDEETDGTRLTEINKQLADGKDADGNDLTDEQKDALKKEQSLLENRKAYTSYNKAISDNTARMEEIAGKIDITFGEDGKAVSAVDNGSQHDEAYQELQDKRIVANDVLNLQSSGNASKYSFTSRVYGTDAEIELNGATFTGSSNTFNVNGLTITAQKETGNDAVTLNTINDTSATYNMIKDVIKEYSELINEIDKLYGADTKTKYKPLTDEEKSAMSDYEVEKWEEKLKEQVLAKDSTLGNIRTAFTSIMNQGFTVGGKTMYLFDFGIETAGYFSAADGEKNALHIHGDEDDDVYSTETNKLKELIASNPDAVSDFFSQLSDAMYSKMSELSSRQAGYRSYGSFYEDVKMKSDYDDYTTKIADLEQQLSDYEDKWYDKFSKMETAMAKMQSNQNALSGMLGG